MVAILSIAQTRRATIFFGGFRWVVGISVLSTKVAIFTPNDITARRPWSTGDVAGSHTLRFSSNCRPLLVMTIS